MIDLSMYPQSSPQLATNRAQEGDGRVTENGFDRYESRRKLHETVTRMPELVLVHSVEH